MDQKISSLTFEALGESTHSPGAKLKSPGSSEGPRPNLPSRQESTKSQCPNLQPRLPLVAGPALSSSPWEVPGMAMVTNVDGGVKALAGWGGPASEWGLPATLPGARLSLMMEELPASWGRLASAARSSGLAGQALSPWYFLDPFPGVHFGKVFLDFFGWGGIMLWMAGSSSESKVDTQDVQWGISVTYLPPPAQCFLS